MNRPQKELPPLLIPLEIPSETESDFPDIEWKKNDREMHVGLFNFEKSFYQCSRFFLYNELLIHWNKKDTPVMPLPALASQIKREPLLTESGFSLECSGELLI